MLVKVTTPFFSSREYTRLLLGEQRTHFYRPCFHPHFRWTVFSLLNRYHRKKLCPIACFVTRKSSKVLSSICMHFLLTFFSHDQTLSFLQTRFRLLIVDFCSDIFFKKCLTVDLLDTLGSSYYFWQALL